MLLSIILTSYGLYLRGLTGVIIFL
jgi:hypothetical protein